MLPPDYVTINQNSSPILQIYTPNTTILTKKDFTEKVSQENLHCVQNLYKNGFAAISKSYPLAINRTFSPIPRIFILSITILIKKNLRTFSQSPRKTYIVCKIGTKKWFCWDFEILPPGYVIINRNFSPIRQIYTPNTTILSKICNQSKFQSYLARLRLVLVGLIFRPFTIFF